MCTAATANRSTVFEPTDLLLLAAYEAVGNAFLEEERRSGKMYLLVRLDSKTAFGRGRGGVEKI
jgi:hypothetical protein